MITNHEQNKDQDTERTSVRSPYAVLGIDPEANPNVTDELVRAAYLSKVKQFPPDRSPAEFEQIRDAYELLRDSRLRVRAMLFSAHADASLKSLLDGLKDERRFCGLDPWLAVLKTASKAR